MIQSIGQAPSHGWCDYRAGLAVALTRAHVGQNCTHKQSSFSVAIAT